MLYPSELRGHYLPLYKNQRADGRIPRMICFLAGLNASDWIAVFSLIAAIGSVYVAWRSFVVGKASLDVAKKMMEDADEDWAQQKWFDLYVKADDAYNLLDRFRQVHSQSYSVNPEKRALDWEETIFALRRAGTRATVFPKHSAIDKLIAASVFKNFPDVNDEKVLAYRDATECLRQMALLKAEVLNRKNLGQLC